MDRRARLSSPATWPQTDDSQHFCNCHNVVVSTFFLPACALGPLLFSFFLWPFSLQFLLLQRYSFSFSCFFVFFFFCCLSLLLIVQTWHYCFLRPTTRKHNVNRAPSLGHAKSLLAKTEEDGTAWPIRTLPYRCCCCCCCCSLLLTSRRCSIVYVDAKLKSAATSEIQRLKLLGIPCTF